MSKFNALYFPGKEHGLILRSFVIIAGVNMNRIFYLVIIQLIFLSLSCTSNWLSLSGTAAPQQLMNYVEAARYVEDLENIAIDRTLDSPGHKVVMEYCAQRLAGMGFRVELDSYGTGTNVIARMEGTDNSGEAVIISAHYDSRNKGCPGADDNASGVAGVLETARVLAKARYHRTLIVALWDEEEKGLKSRRGLIGSRSYAGRSRRQGSKIVLAVVYEMIGYRSSEPFTQHFPARWNGYFPSEMKKVAANKHRGDFICLTVKDEDRAYSDIFTEYADSIGLPNLTLKINRKLINNHSFRRSDHAAFWENGYPALLISDTCNYRNFNYHCHFGRSDSTSRIDTGFACDTIRAAVATVAQVLGIR